MSRIKRTGSSASSSVYGPSADAGADDTATISRDDYDMGSAAREGLGIGKTGGYSGLTYRGGDDNFKVSAGVGKRGSFGVGAKIGFKKGGSTASKRADGCAIKGKTKGRMV